MTAKEALDVVLHPMRAENFRADKLVIATDVLEKAIDRLEELEKRDTPIERIQTMMTWQCLNCGKEVRNNWDYCPICGQKLDWSDEK